AGLRRRLAEETTQLGKLLPVAPGFPREVTVSSPAPAPAAATALAPAPASPKLPLRDADDLFRLAGVTPAPGGLPCILRTVPWLLCGLAGGMAAVVLCAVLSFPPRQLPVLGAVLPLVIVLTERLT